jgi:PIN domain nuclease of toxin-antitoxin system
MYLLDTQIWLWLDFDSSRLTPRVRRVLEGADELFVSVASGWEIGIKHAVGKLSLPAALGEHLTRSTTLNRLRVLPIQLSHVVAAAQLPRHHADPFDRLLVAQAQVEGLTLVSADAQVLRYDVAQMDGR